MLYRGFEACSEFLKCDLYSSIKRSKDRMDLVNSMNSFGFVSEPNVRSWIEDIYGNIDKEESTVSCVYNTESPYCLTYGYFTNTVEDLRNKVCLFHIVTKNIDDDVVKSCLNNPWFCVNQMRVRGLLNSEKEYDHIIDFLEILSSYLLREVEYTLEHGHSSDNWHIKGARILSDITGVNIPKYGSKTYRSSLEKAIDVLWRRHSILEYIEALFKLERSLGIGNDIGHFVTLANFLQRRFDLEHHKQYFLEYILHFKDNVDPSGDMEDPLYLYKLVFSDDDEFMDIFNVDNVKDILYKDIIIDHPNFYVVKRIEEFDSHFQYFDVLSGEPLQFND